MSVNLGYAYVGGTNESAVESTHFTLSWSKLSYSVQRGGTPTVILNNLQGVIRPGTITGVLGQSGSGKSTLLDVLAGRKPQREVHGDILINGSKDISIRHSSRYCTQEDALFGNLTVYETLLYAAHFNLNKSTPLETKKMIVNDIMQEFGLVDARNTIIGTPLRKGCSGGQIRRVSVASQVIGLRNGILFLDEPTSGLDSVAAHSVVTSLQNLANNEESTIMATIHQPSSETFQLFTHLLILAKGMTVYFGPREEAVAFFESIGHSIPMHSNPADVYMQLVNSDFGEDREKSKERILALVEAFKNSETNANLEEEIKIIRQNPSTSGNGNLDYVNGFTYRTKILLGRSAKNAAKNPVAYWIRVAMYVALAILMGTTWFRMDLSQSTVSDRLAGLFFAVAFLSFMSVAGIPALLEERHVFIRESDNGLYGIGSYLLANSLISLPFILIITVSFSSVAYFTMGLHESPQRFLVFVGYLYLALLVAEAQTVLISVSIPIFVAALAVTAFSNGLWMVVQGYFVQKKNIPSFWRYTFHQVDFQKYAYEILITNEFDGLTFDCDPAPPPSESGCNCIIPSMNASTCQFTGDDVLKYYEYSDISYMDWTLILLAILFVYKMATYFILRFVIWKRHTHN